VNGYIMDYVYFKWHMLKLWNTDIPVGLISPLANNLDDILVDTSLIYQMLKHRYVL